MTEQLTIEDKAKIDAAMENTGGDIGNAALLLGTDRNHLWDLLRRNDGLKARWIKAYRSDESEPPPPPTELDTLDRDFDDTLTDTSPVLATERQLAETIANEDKSIASRLSTMGLKTAEVKMANACRKFGQQHFSHILSMMAGGVTKSSMNLMTQMGEVEGRLKTVRGVLNELDQARTDDRDAWVDEETRLANMYVQLQGELRRNWEIANKGAAILATIRRQGEGNRGGRNGAKPAFAQRPIET